jgi:hypothetical protein
MTRKLPFATIENLRDFGDYAAGHRHMKKGVLFRSAHQAEASDEEGPWRQALEEQLRQQRPHVRTSPEGLILVRRADQRH